MRHMRNKFIKIMNFFLNFLNQIPFLSHNAFEFPVFYSLQNTGSSFPKCSRGISFVKKKKKTSPFQLRFGFYNDGYYIADCKIDVGCLGLSTW